MGGLWEKLGVPGTSHTFQCQNSTLPTAVAQLYGGRHFRKDTLPQAGTLWLLRLQKVLERSFLAPERSHQSLTAFFRVRYIKIPACGMLPPTTAICQEYLFSLWNSSLLHVDCPITYKHGRVLGLPSPHSCSYRGDCQRELQVLLDQQFFLAFLRIPWRPVNRWDYGEFLIQQHWGEEGDRIVVLTSSQVTLKLWVWGLHVKSYHGLRSTPEWPRDEEQGPAR